MLLRIRLSTLFKSFGGNHWLLRGNSAGNYIEICGSLLGEPGILRGNPAGHAAINYVQICGELY